MGDQAIIPKPGIKDILMYGTGLGLGFFAPGLFVLIINEIAKSELAGGYLNQKLKQLAGRGVTNGDAADGILYAVIILILAVASVKAAKIGKKLLIGVAVGIILRVIAIYVFGMALPSSPAVGYGTPMNETLNATNSTTPVYTVG